MLMDILRALATPNMDIRKKTLDISLDLITARNIDEVGVLCRLNLTLTQQASMQQPCLFQACRVIDLNKC